MPLATVGTQELRRGNKYHSLRLHMHSHMGFLAIVVSQQILHFRGFVVGLAQTDVAIHHDVQFDGIVIAYPTGMQIMRLHHVRQRCHQLQDLLLYGVGQRVLHQVSNAVS